MREKGRSKMGSVDLTRVDLKPKSVIMLCVALSVLFLAVGIGKWGADKAKTMITKGMAGASEVTEEW